jgi:hypothetical protein
MPTIVFIEVNTLDKVPDLIDAILADVDPKKPTQVPPGDLSDAVGTHEESDFNGDLDDDEADDSDDSDD